MSVDQGIASTRMDGSAVSVGNAAVLNLARPVRSERVRGFQPPWYTVFVYRCDACGGETRVNTC